MNMIKTGHFIQAARKRLNMSQRELGEHLMVTDKAVSKWERGYACPDIETLKNMSLLFNCNITDIINANTQVLEAQCLSLSDHTAAREGTEEVLHEDVRVVFDFDSTQFISPLLFGDNLEHTRGCINGGLSAEILRNRKFVGFSDRYGCAHEWYPIGEKAFLSFGNAGYHQLYGAPYTRHAEGYKMHRRNECNAQFITNYKAETAGFGQKDLYVRADMDYICEIAIRATVDTPVTVRLLGGDRSVYDCKTLTAHPQGYVEESLILRAPKEDWEARLEITFDTPATIMIGAVSLMPADHFHGMRRDVIEQIKQLGIRLLRWPGGNFAGEYNWKDGLLPRNMRAPLQAYLGLETQPHTNGYDFHDINIDDFVALCQEIGAEPFITINPTWNTPEETAQWVEYCNGNETTPYGKMRAERGHKEPYNVQFWSLGNEAGYGHMEGANTADGYARIVREHAQQMLKVSPGLTLCSSGPYPNKDWVDASAKALADIVSMVSLHHYTNFPPYIDPATRGQEYTAFIQSAGTLNLGRIRDLRNMLGNSNVKISFDEWNAWYAWYRPGSVSEGIFVATVLNMLFQNADKYGVGMACHFESVNEGSIMVYPDRAKLGPAGQAFSIMKHHAGGMVCALQQDVVATSKDSVLTCTLINRAFDREKKFCLENGGELISAVVYISDDVVPGSEFIVQDLPVARIGEALEVTLPGHSIAQIQMKLS